MKSVGLDKSLGIDGLPYEVYLRLSHIFVPLLATIYNNRMRHGSITRHFIRGVVKFLRKDKHGGDGISNFRPLTMLNTDLKISAKILADHFQTILPSLICHDKSYIVFTIVKKSTEKLRKANPVLRGLILPESTEVARYTAYTDNVNVFVTSSAEVDEVSKEIGTGAKINREKSVGLRLDSWKGFCWKDGRARCSASGSVPISNWK